MRTITEMEAEISKVIKETSYCGIISEMESKLAVIQHVISENLHQLKDSGFTGISYLISDILKNLTQTEKLCEKVEDYFFFLDNPEFLAEVNQEERRRAEGRN